MGWGWGGGGSARVVCVGRWERKRVGWGGGPHTHPTHTPLHTPTQHSHRYASFLVSRGVEGSYIKTRLFHVERVLHWLASIRGISGEDLEFHRKQVCVCVWTWVGGGGGDHLPPAHIV